MPDGPAESPTLPTTKLPKLNLETLGPWALLDLAGRAALAAPAPAPSAAESPTAKAACEVPQDLLTAFATLHCNVLSFP